MKSLKLNTLLGALLVSGTVGIASQAQALDFSVTPSFMPQPSAVPVGMELVYKAEDSASGAVEDMGGSAWNYYTTEFDPVGEPSGAKITWDGPLWIACPNCYLVVKDGNAHVPPEYIFNISGWNGKDTLVLSGFWSGQGAISNIQIWNNANPGGGGGGSLVPEPETYAMLLAGLGLVGFAARRKLNKTV